MVSVGSTEAASHVRTGDTHLDAPLVPPHLGGPPGRLGLIKSPSDLQTTNRITNQVRNNACITQVIHSYIIIKYILMNRNKQMSHNYDNVKTRINKILSNVILPNKEY